MFFKFQPSQSLNNPYNSPIFADLMPLNITPIFRLSMKAINPLIRNGHTHNIPIIVCGGGESFSQRVLNLGPPGFLDKSGDWANEEKQNLACEESEGINLEISYDFPRFIHSQH